MEDNMPVSGLPFQYCLMHGREVLGEFSENGSFQHLEGIGDLPCRGPFALTPPPPSPTEEEWKTILEEEHHHASQTD